MKTCEIQVVIDFLYIRQRLVDANLTDAHSCIFRGEQGQSQSTVLSTGSVHCMYPAIPLSEYDWTSDVN